MIRATAKQATETMQTCAAAVNREIRPKLEPALADVGLELSQKPAKIDARILRPPTMNYRSGKAEVRDGQWNPQEFRHISGVWSDSECRRHWDGKYI